MQIGVLIGANKERSKSKQRNHFGLLRIEKGRETSTVLLEFMMQVQGR